MAHGTYPAEDEQKVDDSKTTTDRNMNSLRQSLTLSLNSLAVPLSPSIEDVQEGGQILFHNFVLSEFQNQGLNEPPENQLFASEDGSGDNQFANDGTASSRLQHTPQYPPADSAVAANTPEGYKTTNWVKIGRDMRLIADRLAESREGREIREEANRVILNEITEESFFRMMVELFHEGFTIERVVALFYFCTNLIIRAAQQNTSGLTRFLFTWSLNYIRTKVCKWVHQNGGWEKVLSKMYDLLVKFCVVSFLVVSIGCGIAYIRKNW